MCQMWSPWINILALLELVPRGPPLPAGYGIGAKGWHCSLMLQVHLGHEPFVSARDGVLVV